jgi:hypothetical protein
MRIVVREWLAEMLEIALLTRDSLAASRAEVALVRAGERQYQIASVGKLLQRLTRRKPECEASVEERERWRVAAVAHLSRDREQVSLRPARKERRPLT